VFYQLFKGPGDVTKSMEIRGLFKGANQVECVIPMDFGFAGYVYLSLQVNNQYMTNFI